MGSISLIGQSAEPLPAYYLWGMGSGGYGELQNYMSQAYNSNITQIGSDTNWVVVSTTNSTTAIIDSNGTLTTGGDGNYGQLGNGLNGSSNRVSSPSLVGVEGEWSKVYGGAQTFVAIKTDGTLWGWGYNYYGQLGIGVYATLAARSLPVQISSDSWVKASTSEITMAIKDDGSLWSAGRTNGGALGRDLGITPASSFGQVGTDTDWYDIACGDNHTVALKTNGELWTWGENNNGQLGNGNTTDRSSAEQLGSDTDWVEVGANSNSSYAIKSDGTLWAWGSGNIGALGLGDTTSRSSPTQVGSLTDWSKVAGRNNAFLALKTDGTLWASGYNYNGRLGFGDEINRSSPTQLGSDTGWLTLPDDCGTANQSLLISSTGVISGIFVWGTGSSGQLGLNNRDNISSPVLLGSVDDWSYIHINSRAGTFIKPDGTLWVCGNNDHYNLGMGDLIDRSSPTQLGSDTDWSTAHCGYYSSHGIKTSGELWVWGDNGNGQLGLGDRTDRITPVQVGSLTDWSEVLSDDYYYTRLALKTDGTMWSWGYDNYGVLGQGTYFIHKSSPTQIGADSDWGDIAIGTNSCFAIKTDGTLWSWGRNNRGQLGHNDYNINRSSPTQVGSLTNWLQIDSYGDFWIAVKTDGTLWSCGYNYYGQLGDGTYGTGNEKSSPVQVGSDNDWLQVMVSDQRAMAIKTDGTLWGWGSQYGVGLGNGEGTGYSWNPSRISLDTDHIDFNIKGSSGYKIRN